MLPLEHPDRIQIAFDDHRLVNNAGLILPAILAQHLGLPQLVDRHLDLGDAPGRANAGDKLMTLIASALAGGRLHRRRRCRCARGGPPQCWASSMQSPPTPRLRGGRLWAPSCAAFAGATCASWTG